jgi:hypothetical protein
MAIHNRERAFGMGLSARIAIAAIVVELGIAVSYLNQRSPRSGTHWIQ